MSNELKFISQEEYNAQYPKYEEFFGGKKAILAVLHASDLFDVLAVAGGDEAAIAKLRAQVINTLQNRMETIQKDDNIGMTKRYIMSMVGGKDISSIDTKAFDTSVNELYPEYTDIENLAKYIFDPYITNWAPEYVAIFLAKLIENDWRDNVIKTYLFQQNLVPNDHPLYKRAKELIGVA